MYTGWSVVLRVTNCAFNVKSEGWGIACPNSSLALAFSWNCITCLLCLDDLSLPCLPVPWLWNYACTCLCLLCYYIDCYLALPFPLSPAVLFLALVNGGCLLCPALSYPRQTGAQALVQSRSEREGALATTNQKPPIWSRQVGLANQRTGAVMQLRRGWP